MSSDGGDSRRITSSTAESSPGSWSADGKWIYFDTEGQIWRVRPDGTGLRQITTRGGNTALEAADGRSLYYLKPEQGSSSLWRVAVSGGEETRILSPVYANDFAPTERGIFYIPQMYNSSVQFFDFRTRRSIEVARIQGQPAWGISVSPDRRSLIYSLYNLTDDLMLVEDFEP